MIYAYEKRSLKLIRMKFDKNHQMPKPSSEIRATVSARDLDLSTRDFDLTLGAQRCHRNLPVTHDVPNAISI